MSFQLNWRPEFAQLDPYLRRGGAVVRVRFADENCAPNHFNAIVKEKFATYGGKGKRVSIRLNPLWHTTHTFEDILDQIEQKLRDVGFPVATAAGPAQPARLFSDMEAGEGIHVSIVNSTIAAGATSAGPEHRHRLSAACAALRSFLSAGGGVLLELVDSNHHYQSGIWHGFWYAGLSDLVESGLLLLYMVGPESSNREHSDAPVPDAEITLPRSFETEDERQYTVTDDLIDAFEKHAGLSRDMAWSASVSLLDATKQSVSAVHDGLAGSLLRFKALGSRPS